MSRGLNRIQLIGNLGRDPEMRYTASGKPVTQFSLAVNRPRRSGGNQQEETDWFRVVWRDRPPAAGRGGHGDVRRARARP